jgi:hypothetical protein
MTAWSIPAAHAPSTALRAAAFAALQTADDPLGFATQVHDVGQPFGLPLVRVVVGLVDVVGDPIGDLLQEYLFGVGVHAGNLAGLLQGCGDLLLRRRHQPLAVSPA